MRTGKILTRRAKRSDVERLVELRLLHQKHGEASSPSIWRITEEGRKLLRQRVENDLVDSNTCVLVAESSGEVIGFVQGEVTHRSDYLPRSVGSISVIYVMSKSRRKGVGTDLLKELCRFFSSEGVEHVTLRYIIGNKDAERFWRKFGFEPLLTTVGTNLRELNSVLQVPEEKVRKD